MCLMCLMCVFDMFDVFEMFDVFDVFDMFVVIFQVLEPLVAKCSDVTRAPWAGILTHPHFTDAVRRRQVRRVFDMGLMCFDVFDVF